MIKPTRDKILIEILTIGDKRAQDAAAKIPGFEIPDPEFQGIPNQGRIYAIGEDAELEAAVGDMVIFRETKPRGFKHEGLKLFAVYPSQVIARIEDA